MNALRRDQNEIVLCVGLNEPCLETLAQLADSQLIKNAKKIHLIHCFEIQIYTSELVAPYIFPTKDKYPEIEAATTKILENLAIKLGVEKDKYALQCFFTESPKKKTKEYLEEVGADLCVVATRGKHGIKGLFSSSFAEHLLKYSPCDIYVLRP